jgi:GTPase SAR1 family protein
MGGVGKTCFVIRFIQDCFLAKTGIFILIFFSCFRSNNRGLLSKINILTTKHSCIIGHP